MKNSVATTVRAMPESSRKSKVTEATRAEARRLRLLWDSRAHPPQAVFGEQFDIGNQSAVGQFLRGEVVLSLKAARGFARGLGVEISEFSPRLAAEAAKNAEFAPAPDESDFVPVKRVDVNVAAGHGAEAPPLEETIGHLKFAKSFLRGIGVSPGSARVVNVRGPSMDPIIPDGATLLVNTANRLPARDKYYVFWRRDEGLVVKKAVKEGGRWLARSENDDRSEYPDFLFENDDRLLGRAVWMGVKL